MGADDHDTESVKILTEIRERLAGVLEEAIPELSWKKEIRGAAMPSAPTGTVSADEITFTEKYKGCATASFSFSVILIVPDGSLDAEELAMRARDALDGDDLGGAAQDVRVTKILFGAPPGRSTDAAAAVLLCEVDSFI